MENASGGKDAQYSPVDGLEASIPVVAARVENDTENVVGAPSSTGIAPHSSSGKIRWTLLIATYIFGFVSGIAFSRKYPQQQPSSLSIDDDKVNTIPLPTTSPSLSNSPTNSYNPTNTYNYWSSSFQTPSPTTPPTQYPTKHSTTPPSFTHLSHTPSPSAETTTETHEENELVLVNETSFTDEKCPDQSYKSTQHFEKTLLWAHIYTPNNHPPPKPVGPFDDLPPDPINTAHVLLDIKPTDFPIILALAAYESTNWTIDIGGVGHSSNLVHVIAAGYKAQYVNILHNISDIQIDTFDTTTHNNMPGNSMSPYPSTIIPGSLKEYRADLERYVGVPVYLYDYCHYGSEMEYHFDFST